MKLSQLFTAAALTTAIIASPAAFANAQISAQQAASIAAKQVGGKVTDVDYERRSVGASYYDVEVRKSNGQKYDVRVNAKTGKVMSSRLDRDDDWDDRNDHDDRNDD
ncbi:MAG: PepSY domain-containing protein [Acinetobacter sp.]|nr:PepSY domain-containing protein [Acinetobacter sp.]